MARTLRRGIGDPSQNRSSKETDPLKLMTLIGKLCRALEGGARGKSRENEPASFLPIR